MKIDSLRFNIVIQPIFDLWIQFPLNPTEVTYLREVYHEKEDTWEEINYYWNQLHRVKGLI